MIPYPDIDPVLISFGPIQIRWYGLAYILGILLGFRVCRTALKKRVAMTNDQILTLMSYLLVGVILGGRLGYAVFYDFAYYLESPIRFLYLWQGGMSYHGGAIGCVISTCLFSRFHQKSFWMLLDLLGLGACIGIFLGRLANFINGELYGRVTEMPWGMIFPHGGPFVRHPSQLYEAFFEGFVLFLILLVIYRRVRLPSGCLFSIYLICYGSFRVILEEFREPDAHLGFVLRAFTMGQLLSGLMIILGCILAVYRWRYKTPS